MSEKVYYQGDNVLITSTRAEMEGKTFVMSNITSVSLVKVSEAVVVEPDGCMHWGWLVFFIVVTLLSFAIIGEPNWLTGLGVLGILAWFGNRSNKPTPRKAEYAVNISSSSGETRARQSIDLSDIEKIVAAIKQAVIDSGVQKVESVSSAQVANPSDDVLQKLQSLKSLLDSGILTPQEYETKKAEILSRM